jgi:predicted MFS family arabinose efflux permease
MYIHPGSIIKNLKSKLIHILNPEDEIEINRKNITISNYSSGVVNNLIGGNFFIVLLLLMKADDSYMGLVTMAGLIGNLLQVLSPLVLERFQSRKKLLIGVRAVIYFFNIVVISIVSLLPVTNGIKLMMVLLIILFINFINALSAPGFMVWHIKSIPEKVRSNYFSFFTITNGIIIYTIILTFSKIVDYFKASGNELQVLLILRILTLLLCVVDICFLFKIKEYPNQSSGTKVSFVSIFVAPFKEKKYLITVLIACLWNFSANIPGPYFTVYMLKDLGVSYSFLNLVNMFNIPALIFLTPLWRKKINTTSWFKTLYLSMGLFLITYILLSFVTKNTLYLFPIAVIFSFLVAPGINLVFANIPFINIPEKDQTNYIGFFAAMNNLAALIGVLTGKEFIKHTEGITISILGIGMQNKQYILILTAFAMFIAVILIYLMQRKN